ncbi:MULTISPECIES: hypothetical protein [Planktothricoides]|uniref:Uncharacterized protein n=1 Tax=Planktothricoides raciborskii FACHB-1370 TaxID=2949576 RepID=A0ABR8E8S6_9CYAN|nr:MULTISPECIES: hypothetical protein [Planktothricoides]MBD2542549.1 hypothetical protein [Planktothricoides raciborskii FACHB-1370]MBD2581006.1 hypothetical protein [Planktothricoides raciborskii FACHB-1261]
MISLSSFTRENLLTEDLGTYSIRKSSSVSVVASIFLGGDDSMLTDIYSTPECQDQFLWRTLIFQANNLPLAFLTVHYQIKKYYESAAGKSPNFATNSWLRCHLYSFGISIGQ